MNEHEQRKQALYRAIRARGLSHAHAMGMLANAMGESNFRPDALNKPEGAYGLFQWRGERLEALRNKYGPNPNIEAQVEFALSEPEGRAYAETHFDDPVKATDWFIRKFERPADPDAALRKRGSWAQSNAANFGATPPPSVPPAHASGYPGLRPPTWPPPGIDPTSSARVPVGQGFQPAFQGGLDALIAAAREAGHNVSISSGYRTPARQKMLWDQAVAKYGSPEAARKHVAPPGSSAHNHGFAADLAYGNDAAKQWVHENAGRFGLGFRLGHEDWHIEPAGYHPRYGTEWTPDTRMASINGGGMAVGPYGLADRWSQLPQLPEEQPMEDPTMLHPQLQAILEQQNQKPDPWKMLGAFGVGVLNAGGGPGAGNWFGKGVAAALDSVQQDSPEGLNMLQMLQANNELYELDARRAEKQRMQQQQAMQRQYLQSIADNESLPMPTRYQARNQLMGLKGDAIELPTYEENWTTSGSPSQGLYRVNPDTGEVQQLLEPTPGGPDEPKYGTGFNTVRMGQNEDGTTKWGLVRLNDRGEQEVVPLPENVEPWSGVQNDPELIRQREMARKYGGMEPEALQNFSTQLVAAKTQLAQTNYLLKELESGKYDKSLGPIKGQIKKFFDPQTALWQMYSVDAALKNLQTVNLAPVTEFELGLIMQMDANAFKTVEQNKAVLGRLKAIREAKVKLLDESLRKIQTEGYQSFVKSKPKLDPALFEPIEGLEDAEPAATADEEEGWGPITFE